VSSVRLPAINALVDIALIDGSSYPSRVEDLDLDSGAYMVGAPFGIPIEDVPEIGAIVELAWLHDDSRLTAPAKLEAITRGRPRLWQVRIAGDAKRQTRRAFVRGGGGELVDLLSVDGSTAPDSGRVIDLSEGGVRCRTRIGDFARDQRVTVELRLDADLVQIGGRVLFVRRNVETADFDVVVEYETSETVGRLIRSYVLRRQMKERRRLANL
jgi:hypothetical protein